MSFMPGTKPGRTVRALAEDIGSGADASASESLPMSLKVTLGAVSHSLFLSRFLCSRGPMGAAHGDDDMEAELLELLTCHRSVFWRMLVQTLCVSSCATDSERMSM